MELRNLDFAERKELYKIVTLDSFKKIILKKKLKTIVMVSMKKDFTRVTKGEMIAYLEESIVNEKDNKIVDALGEALFIMFFAKLKSAKKLKEMIENYTYVEVPDNIKGEIEEFRNEYECLDMRISYDAFIRSLCKLNKQRAKETTENGKKNMRDKKINDIENAKSENDVLKKKLTKLQKEYDKANNELQKTIKKNDKLTESLLSKDEVIENYKRIFTTKQIIFNLKEVLGIEVVGKKAIDIYKGLKVMEEEYVVSKEYGQVKNILAAKLAVLNIMEVAKNE